MKLILNEKKQQQKLNLTLTIPQVVKFSFDEGNCWHVYKFTNEDIK